MGYADELTSQGCFYTSNGLSREVMSACQPFGDFCVSLVEQAGEILLGETLGFQNLTNALGNTERQIELCLLLGICVSGGIDYLFIIVKYSQDFWCFQN